MFEMSNNFATGGHWLRQLLQSDECVASVEESCINPGLAQKWAIISLFLILAGGLIGVLLPLLSRKVRWFGVESTPFVMGRAFAAGVVLATGFVHMFPEAIESLENPCLGWIEFPWASCIAVGAALGTNLIEFVAGQVLYSRMLKAAATAAKAPAHGCDVEDGDCGGALVAANNSRFMEHGVHVPAGKQATVEEPPMFRHEDQVVVTPCGHTHVVTNEDRAWTKARKHAVAQILEMGIALHSVLIGITLGVSPSPCTIRPLAAALVFHQCFEGFALGGTLIDADYQLGPYLIMGIFFVLTTPGGVALGLGIKSTYNDNSPAALGVAGVFDSLSTGILIYMALVNLIAVDFFGDRMRRSSKMHQFLAYVALFTGAGAMCLLAKWA